MDRKKGRVRKYKGLIFDKERDQRICAGHDAIAALRSKLL